MKCHTGISPSRIFSTLTLAGVLMIAGTFHNSGVVQAGTVVTAITAKSSPDGSSGKQVFPSRKQWKTITIYLDRDKLRMDGAEGGMIYRADRKMMYVLSPDTKSYQEISEEFLRQGMKQANDAMAQVREQMANLPPAQRKMMEQMLAQQGKGMPPGMGGPPGQQQKPRPTYRAGKRGQRIGKWRCDAFSEYRAGQKVSESCIGKMGSLGLRKGDLSVLNAFEKLMKNSSMGGDSGPALSPDAIRAMAGYDGFPVQTIEFKSSSIQEKTVLQRIDNKSIPASVFEVPRGYTKSQMGG